MTKQTNKTKKVILPVAADVPVEITKALPVPPTTTEQEDIASQEERAALHRMRDGQRRISLIWEVTQAIIAVMITMAVVYIAVTGKVSEVLTNSFFLIIGFYFSRTNHTKVGGIGPIREGETR